MSGLVVDASTALSWCFEDEAGPGADALIERISDEGATVPGHWALEIGNGLVMGERRGRIDAAAGAAFVGLLEALPIAADAETEHRALHETAALAREHGLTSYDAAYLELAMRLELPLATNDRALAGAAARAGVLLIDGM